MKIEIEITKERYELLQQYALLTGVTVDAYINFALYDLLRKQGALSIKRSRENDK